MPIQPVQSEVHHVEPELDRVDLDDPEDHPPDPEEDEEEEPEPDDEEDLVVDDVEGEHADGVDRLLLAPGAETVPVARGDPEGTFGMRYRER